MRSLALGALLAVLAGGCSRAEPAARADGPPAAASGTVEPEEPVVTASSVFDLAIPLTDQDGQKLALDGHPGPVLITMFYATCPAACPLLVADLKAIEAAMDPATREATRVVLVSFDPERDTTATLKALAQKHKIDERRWRFARAADGDVRTLAAVLGIKYRKLPNGHYNHSSVIALLDRKGAVAARLEGQEQPSDALRAAAKAIASGL